MKIGYKKIFCGYLVCTDAGKSVDLRGRITDDPRRATSFTIEGQAVEAAKEAAKERHASYIGYIGEE